MKRKFISVLAAGALCASMAMPAMAAESNGGVTRLSAEGTDVMAGVLVTNKEVKVKVEVPTVFAFVVNGSVSADSTAISVDNNTLVLPNVTTDGNSLTFTGDGSMKLINYSTIDDGTTFKGLDVTVDAYIKNEGTAASRNGWEHVAAAPSTAPATDVKHYRLSITDPTDSTVGGAFSDTSKNLDQMWMANSIKLAAPSVDTTSKEVTTANELDVDFSVEVGGTKGDYNAAEPSAKVGSIVWEVTTPDITTP